MITARAMLPCFTKSCTYLFAPVTHYRTFIFPVPRRRRHRRRPKQSQRNSVASSRSDGYHYQRKEVRPARHFECWVTHLLVSCQTRGVSRQASTTRWFQSSIWRISPRQILFPRVQRECVPNAISILISTKILREITEAIIKYNEVLKDIKANYCTILRVLLNSMTKLKTRKIVQ